MSGLWPVLGLAAAAAITPGPNNLLVLAAVRRGGLPAAARTIAGVLAGSMVLFGLVAAGLAPMRAAVPAAGAAIALAGAAYLGALAVAMLRQAGRDGGGAGPLPETPLGVAAFQLVNPKGWVLMTTVAAAAPTSMATASLAAAVSIVFLACLGAWAAAGAVLTRLWATPRSAAMADRVLAAGLLVCAIGIVADQIATHLAAGG